MTSDRGIDHQQYNVSREDDFSPNSLKTVKRRFNKETDVKAPNHEETKTSGVSLKKNIGFLSGLGMLIGMIVGSGIFVSPKGVLIGSGSVGVALIVWILCGVISLIGALVYVELGTLLPNSGGAYYYLLTAFHPNRREEKSFIRSLVPFLYFWQYSCLSRPAAMAVQGKATAQYIMQLASLGGCGSSLSEENSARFAKLLTVVIIMMITALNSYSTKLSTRLVNFFTFAKMLAILFIIASGLVMLSKGTNEALKTGFEGTTTAGGIVNAFYSGLWAYAGWGRLNLVTRELKNPKRDLPRSMFSAILILTSIYLLMNVSYFALLSKESFLASDAVAADFADKVIGKSGVVFIIFSVALSILGSLLGSSFTTNRVMYAAAREGHIIDVLSYIHYERMTPSPAAIFTGMIAVMLSPQVTVVGLLSLSGFVSAIFSFMTIVALLILRKNRKRDKNDLQVPFVLIIINMVQAFSFVVLPFVNNPRIEYLYVVAFMMLGVPVYTVFVYYKKSIPGTNKVTVFVQKIFEVVPPEDDEV